MGEMVLITPKITNLGYSNLWTDMSTILGYASNFAQQIQKLFANGEQGFFYDPNDLSTMFQDAAGTIPITAAGQLVGLIRDKSGRNNHAYQTASASRPILRRNATTGAYYLAFDGVDDFLVTNNINFTATDKVSLFAGVRKLSDAATAVVAELGTDSITVNGTFGLFAPAGTGVTKFQFLSRGATGTNYAQALNAIYNAPISAVVRGIGSIANQNSELHVNRALAGKSPTGLTGAGNYSASPLYIGRRAGLSLPFSGNLYGLIGVGRLTTDGETLALEKAIAKATGVTLNV